MERTGAQIVWEVLTQEGVEVVFGYPEVRFCRLTMPCWIIPSGMS